MEKKNSMLDLLKKKQNANFDLVDNISATVHQAVFVPLPVKEQATAKKEEEPTKRISLNTPISTYIEVKSLSVKNGMTLMQYVLTLIDEDIKRSKK